MTSPAPKARAGVDVAKIIFRAIPEKVIEDLIKRGDIFFLAGAFSVEDQLLKAYIERIDGAVDSVIGLPKELTKRLIKQVEARTR